MSIKYNKFGEVISVNGLTTGQHLGTPMQDAAAKKPEDNEVYSEELNTVGNSKYTVDDAQPEASVSGKIKPEQLPDGYPYEGVESVVYNNGAYQEGDEVFAGMLFKVSNDTPTYAELLGGKIVFPDGEMIVDESILRGNEDLMIVGEACIVTYRDNVEVFNGTILPTKGMYMVILSLAPISLICSKNVVKPIDPKFLPKITIVKDGYDDAVMGVAPALTVAETATANATFSDVMQGLMTKTLPPIELYTHNNGMLEHLYGGSVKMVMLGSGELYLEITFFEANTTDGVAGYKNVSWRSDNSIEVSNMSIR